MKTESQFQHCMVLAGGGFRFAYQLGMHAAAEDAGRAPDVLLGTCGGALAAAIITGHPDRERRRACLASPEMFAFLQRVQPGPGAALWPALRGWWRRLRPASQVPDVFRDFMFALPPSLPLPTTPAPGAPEWAVVGTRLEFTPEDVGRAIDGRQLYTQCVFGTPCALARLHGQASPIYRAEWGSALVRPQVLAVDGVSAADAARISMADMVYFPSQSLDGRAYLGGVLDLFPVELATQLSPRISMEAKGPFAAWTAAAALRHVLGVDGNRRLRHVLRQPVETWIDTRDVAEVLRKDSIDKTWHWPRARIALRLPPTLAAYQAQIARQWDYGYQRARQAYAQGGMR